MATLLSQDNHKCLKVVPEVAQLCQPLFSRTCIKSFLLIKVYDNGARYQLGTLPGWLAHYIEQDYQQKTCLQPAGSHDQDHYILYDAHMKNVVFQDAVNHFGMHHGFIIATRLGDHTEYCHFSAEKAAHEATQFYFNNLDLLERFILYFKARGRHLIRDVRAYVPATRPVKVLSDPKEINTGHQVVRLPLKSISLPGTKSKVSLTAQEAACLSEFLHGKTAKEIGETLCRSNRTVEHYLNCIKKKLHCGSRSQIHAAVEKHHLFEALYHLND